MARSVVLSGFMATGKSTVGPLLAERLGLAFADTDAIIAAEAKRSVSEVWREEGEGAFRRREADIAMRLLSDGTPRVIAFGGGTATVRSVRHYALDHAFVVTLSARAPVLVGRVSDLAGRPNLAVGDPIQRAEELMGARADAYAECHLDVNTEGLSPAGVADAIVNGLRRDTMVMPLGRRSYRIYFGYDEPPLLASVLRTLKPTKIVVVDDSHVERARGQSVRQALHAVEVPDVRVTLPAGEQHKNLSSIATIWDGALGAGIDRDALVLAFGGGVVGDLAGFAASTLLRGLRFIQVPTTLLAMVDSSVGGKTGFDHTAGKNLLGSFYQPSAVVVDAAHLSTLPTRERIAGFAEVVKIALATDANLFDALEQMAPRLASDPPETLLPIIRAAVAAKARVVRDDETEQGLRALLNVGHTIGHALEAHGDYTRHLHGEAVALGTLVELGVAVSMGVATPALLQRTRDLLRTVGLPTEVPHSEVEGAWPYIGADKKRRGGSVAFPLVSGVGAASVVSLELERLHEHVRRAVSGFT